MQYFRQVLDSGATKTHIDDIKSEVAQRVASKDRFNTRSLLEAISHGLLDIVKKAPDESKLEVVLRVKRYNPRRRDALDFDNVRVDCPMLPRQRPRLVEVLSSDGKVRVYSIPKDLTNKHPDTNKYIASCSNVVANPQSYGDEFINEETYYSCINSVLRAHIKEIISIVRGEGSDAQKAKAIRDKISATYNTCLRENMFKVNKKLRTVERTSPGRRPRAERKSAAAAAPKRKSASPERKTASSERKAAASPERDEKLLFDFGAPYQPITLNNRLGPDGAELKPAGDVIRLDMRADAAKPVKLNQRLDVHPAARGAAARPEKSSVHPATIGAAAAAAAVAAVPKQPSSPTRPRPPPLPSPPRSPPPPSAFANRSKPSTAPTGSQPSPPRNPPLPTAVRNEDHAYQSDASPPDVAGGQPTAVATRDEDQIYPSDASPPDTRAKPLAAPAANSQTRAADALPAPKTSRKPEQAPRAGPTEPTEDEQKPPEQMSARALRAARRAAGPVVPEPGSDATVPNQSDPAGTPVPLPLSPAFTPTPAAATPPGTMDGPLPGSSGTSDLLNSGSGDPAANAWVDSVLGEPAFPRDDSSTSDLKFTPQPAKPAPQPAKPTPQPAKPTPQADESKMEAEEKRVAKQMAEESANLEFFRKKEDHSLNTHRAKYDDPILNDVSQLTDALYANDTNKLDEDILRRLVEVDALAKSVQRNRNLVYIYNNTGYESDRQALFARVNCVQEELCPTTRSKSRFEITKAISKKGLSDHVAYRGWFVSGKKTSDAFIKLTAGLSSSTEVEVAFFTHPMMTTLRKQTPSVIGCYHVFKCTKAVKALEPLTVASLRAQVVKDVNHLTQTRKAKSGAQDVPIYATVLEYVPMTLSHYLRETIADESPEFQQNEIIDACLQIAQLLTVFEKFRIMHRDLHMSNILVRDMPAEVQEEFRTTPIGRRAMRKQLLVCDFDWAVKNETTNPQTAGVIRNTKLSKLCTIVKYNNKYDWYIFIALLVYSLRKRDKADDADLVTRYALKDGGSWPAVTSRDVTRPCKDGLLDEEALVNLRTPREFIAQVMRSP